MIVHLIGAALGFVLGKKFAEATREEVRCKSWLQIEDPLSEHSSIENRHIYAQRLLGLKSRKKFLIVILVVLSVVPGLFAMANVLGVSDAILMMAIGSAALWGLGVATVNVVFFFWSYRQHKQESL